MPSTKKPCERGGCEDWGRTEFCGFCAFHWAEKSDKERKVLLERYVPDVIPIERDVIERVRTVYPSQPRSVQIIGWVWRVAITAAVGWMGWRMKR